MRHLLLDCDGVLGDFTSEVVAFCNLHGREPGRPFWTSEDVKDHDILKSFGLEWLQPKLRQHLDETKFCQRMPVYPGARNFVWTLAKRFKITIVTSPYVTIRGWETDRRDWLSTHFGIPHGRVIFAKHKERTSGEYLVDDKTENCHDFDEFTTGEAVCLDRPWNRDCRSRRAMNYDHALEILQ